MGRRGGCGVDGKPRTESRTFGLAPVFDGVAHFHLHNSGSECGRERQGGGLRLSVFVIPFGMAWFGGSNPLQELESRRASMVGITFRCCGREVLAGVPTALPIVPDFVLGRLLCVPRSRVATALRLTRRRQQSHSSVSSVSVFCNPTTCQHHVPFSVGAHVVFQLLH